MFIIKNSWDLSVLTGWKRYLSRERFPETINQNIKSQLKNLQI